MAESKKVKKVDKKLTLACEKVRKLLGAADRADVNARHKVGVIVAAVMDAKVYGANGVRRMEDQLGRDQGTLYRYAKVARTWSTTEFKKLASKPNKKGLPLTWSHWEAIADVDNAKVRRELLAISLRESLSVRGLRARITAGEDQNADATGSTPDQSDLKAIVARLDKFVDKVEEEAKSWGNRLEGDIGLAVEEMTVTERANLVATVNRMADAGSAIRDAAARLRVMLEVASPAVSLFRPPLLPTAPAAASGAT